MILFELCNTEDDPVYQALAVSNQDRQYDFLRSVVSASIASQRTLLSTQILKALNYHAITCLHVSAGEFRPTEVTVGKHNPPRAYRVEALMNDFINQVNRAWDQADPVQLAAWVLWRLCHIHPFINGNGRTARAAAYFVVCVKLGGWLPGSTTLMELLKRERPEYEACLAYADQNGDIGPLQTLMARLLDEQIQAGKTPTDLEASQAGGSEGEPPGGVTPV